MASPEIIKILKEMGGTQYGNALQVYLEGEYSKIADVRNAESWEETLGRKLAVKVLDELFNFMRIEGTVKSSKNIYK